MTRQWLKQQGISFYPFLLVCAYYAYYCLSHVWMHDDAYITFRVVDNFIHGYGLRWNVDERVQVYTHPLWMMAHIPVYFLSGNIYLSSLFVSSVCAAFAVGFLLKVENKTYIDRALLVLAPMMLIKPIYTFMMCGLEAPLAMALFSWFLYTLTRPDPSVYKLAFIASLIMLTRLDYIVLLAPCLLWAVFAQKQISYRKLIKSLWPLLSWLGFCLLYYGFMLPNTKYAKLNTGIPFGVMLRQGARYVAHYVVLDSLGAACIIASFGIAVHRLLQAWPWQPLKKLLYLPVQCPIAAGLLAYVFYIIYIGGDYVEGRFFAIPAYIALWVLYVSIPSMKSYRDLQLPVTVGALTGVLMLANPLIVHGMLPKGRYAYGIHNEYAFYRPNSELLLYPRRGLKIRTAVSHSWAGQGRGLNEQFWHNEKTVFYHAIGMYGYYAGPQIRIIDDFALGDALLARLPAYPRVWRIGHFIRPVPAGYYEARDKGDTHLMQEDIREYYEKLRLLTSAPLLDGERLITIIGFQLGQYDYLLKAYHNKNKRS